MKHEPTPADGMSPEAYDICNQMDAAMFSSDTFHSEENLAGLEWFILRWRREAASIRTFLADRPDDQRAEYEADPPAMFRNHYVCPDCEQRWSDDYPAQPDDDCPRCGCRHISPHESEGIEPPKN